jgi:hypothetical protein
MINQLITKIEERTPAEVLHLVNDLQELAVVLIGVDEDASMFAEDATEFLFAGDWAGAERKYECLVNLLEGSGVLQ